MTTGPASARAQVLVAADVLTVDTGELIALDAADAHHLGRVLRLGSDEVVTATDGAGAWRSCRLVVDAPAGGRRRDGGSALIAVGPVLHVAAPAPLVTVAFAPVKGDRPEWVVQKLTEIGVDRIVVIEAERSVVRWDGDRVTRNLERLRSASREALCQCRRVHLPEILGPFRATDLATALGETVVFAEPGSSGVPCLDVPTVAIGPEGGWSASELGAVPTIDLGPTTLRAETAALVAGSLLCALRSGTVRHQT